MEVTPFCHAYLWHVWEKICRWGSTGVLPLICLHICTHLTPLLKAYFCLLMLSLCWTVLSAQPWWLSQGLSPRLGSWEARMLNSCLRCGHIIGGSHQCRFKWQGPVIPHVHGIWELENLVQFSKWSSFEDSSLAYHRRWDLHEELLWSWWARKHFSIQKRTQEQPVFFYCRTLLLCNPNIVSAFIFCPSLFTYIQYYVIEENGDMQANFTLFPILYIWIPALFIWVLLTR